MAGDPSTVSGLARLIGDGRLDPNIGGSSFRGGEALGPELFWRTNQIIVVELTLVLVGKKHVAKSTEGTRNSASA